MVEIEKQVQRAEIEVKETRAQLGAAKTFFDIMVVDYGKIHGTNASL